MHVIPIRIASVDFPKLEFKFEPLEKVEAKHKNDTIDVIAICQRFGPIQPITLKNGAPGRKRELFLIDQTKEVKKLKIPTGNDNYQIIE